MGGGARPGTMEITQLGKYLLYKHGEPAPTGEGRNCFLCVVCSGIPVLEMRRQFNP